jgi:hypothetical protein
LHFLSCSRVPGSSRVVLAATNEGCARAGLRSRLDLSLLFLVLEIGERERERERERSKHSIAVVSS